MDDAAVDFDATPYLHPPRVDVRQAVALAIALITAAPKGASLGVKKAGQRLHKGTVALQKAWGAKERAATALKTGESKALADNRIDTAWGAFRMRLDGYAALPADEHPLATRAGELVRILFSNGMSFLAMPMEAEWAVSDALLKRMKDEKLEADADTIAGPEFRAEIIKAHENYGKVLGITHAKAPEPTVGELLTPLRELVRCIGDYTLQVAASVDRDHPETIMAARAALAPLDRYREASARRKGSKPTEEEAVTTPETPVPDAPK